jgi:hypothetical protein
MSSLTTPAAIASSITSAHALSLVALRHALSPTGADSACASTAGTCDSKNALRVASDRGIDVLGSNLQQHRD